MTEQYPKAINHVGITVTNLEEAIDFYTRTLGFKVVRQETINTDDESLVNAKIFKDIFKRLVRIVNVAWLNSGNGIGLELFEFKDPKPGPHADTFENWKKRFSHICITDPNIEELCNKIISNGGSKHSEYWNPTEGKDYRLVYCRDPFGNFIEIFTHDYEQVITGK